MTDSDIIKALEHCASAGDCLACPAFEKNTNCMITLGSAVKRQQAEIERLTAEKDNLIRNYKECALEAVRDFVKRLEEKAVRPPFVCDDWFVTVRRINEVVAEMEGKPWKK